jgi:hypothetical protein
MRKRQSGVSIYRRVHCSSEWRHTERWQGIKSGLEILERKHNGGSETVTVTHKYKFHSQSTWIIYGNNGQSPEMGIGTTSTASAD